MLRCVLPFVSTILVDFSPHLPTAPLNDTSGGSYSIAHRPVRATGFSFSIAFRRHTAEGSYVREARPQRESIRVKRLHHMTSLASPDCLAQQTVLHLRRQGI